MKNESFANSVSMFCICFYDKYVHTEDCVEFALLAVSQAASMWVSDVLFMMFINELSRCWRGLERVHLSDIAVISCYVTNDIVFLVSLNPQVT